MEARLILNKKLTSHQFISCIPHQSHKLVFRYLLHWITWVGGHNRPRPRIQIPKTPRKFTTSRLHPLVVTNHRVNRHNPRRHLEIRKIHRNWILTVDYCGIFYNNCSMTHSKDTLLILLGKIRIRVYSKLSIRPDWPNCGAFRKITYQWTMIRCLVRWDITIESTFCEKCKEKGIVISKFILFLSYFLLLFKK